MPLNYAVITMHGRNKNPVKKWKKHKIYGNEH